MTSTYRRYSQFVFMISGFDISGLIEFEIAMLTV